MIRCLFGFHQKPFEEIFDQYQVYEKKNKPIETFERIREICLRCKRVIREAHVQKFNFTKLSKEGMR